MNWRPHLPAAAAGIVTTAAALTLFFQEPAFLRALKLKVEDRIVALTKPGPASGRVVIVDLDETSLSRYGRWPWPRDLLARLIDRIAESGAEVVALDMMFPEPDPAPSTQVAGRTNDEVLAQTLAARRVLIGYHFRFDAPKPPAGCVLHPMPIPAEYIPLRLFQALDVRCSLRALGASTAGSGFLNASPDVDGVLRRVPVLIGYRGRVYPSLALAAWQSLKKGAIAARPDGLSLDARRLPVDERGGLRLRFRGPSRTFTRISAADILAGSAEMVRGRAVFVGASAPGVQDSVATPADTDLAGTEVHATALDNLLQSDYICDSGPARALELILIAAGCLLSTLALARLKPFRAVGVLAGIVAAGWFGSIVLLEKSGLSVSPVIFTAGIGANLTVFAAWSFGVERKRAEQAERRREGAQRFVLNALTLLTEARDLETGEHLVRTQIYTRLLCEALAGSARFVDFLTPETIDLLVQIVPLHDIGKIGVPDSILKKPGPLTPEEFKQIQRHVEYGHEVIEKARVQSGLEDEKIFGLVRDTVLCHHERWDGKGYPQGLKADLIPPAGRIVALVDTYDALLSKRVYKDALKHDEAVRIINEGRGERFDPDVVDAFLRTQVQWRRVAEEHAAEPG